MHQIPMTQINKISDTPPVFPCWLYEPRGAFAWMRYAEPAHDYGLKTHWSPDASTAPTEGPDEQRIGGFRITPQGFKMNEPLPPTAEETAAYRAEEAADIAASLPPTSQPAKGTNDGFPVRSDDYREGFGAGLHAQGLIDAAKLAEVERERDALSRRLDEQYKLYREETL